MDPTQSDDAAILAPNSKEKTKKSTVSLRRVGSKKGGAVIGFVLRLCASGAAFGAAAEVGQAEQVLPFFTQFFQFHAQYNDLSTLTFFVAANAVVGGYLVLSLPFSIICILRPHRRGLRLLLIILDTAMTTLTIAAAAAAAAVMYLAHNGSVDANWPAICQQYTDFCQQISGAVVASFVAGVFLISLVSISAFGL